MRAIETMPSEMTAGRRLGFSVLKTVARTLWSGFGKRRDLRRTRLHLFELSDSALRDIGLTREVADSEASRSLLACYLNNAR